jgi:hypothetical protein
MDVAAAADTRREQLSTWLRERDAVTGTTSTTDD